MQNRVCDQFLKDQYQLVLNIWSNYSLTLDFIMKQLLGMMAAAIVVVTTHTEAGPALCFHLTKKQFWNIQARCGDPGLTSSS